MSYFCYEILVWILFFPLKRSSSYDGVCVAYINPNCSAMGLSKICMKYMPLVILALAQGLEMFLCGKEIWFFFFLLLCDKYFVYAA